jgi:hypothetical protein
MRSPAYKSLGVVIPVVKPDLKALPGNAAVWLYGDIPVG